MLTFRTFFAELDQIAFPMPKCLRSLTTSRSPSDTMRWQMSPHFERIAFCRIGELVDRFAAHRDRIAFQPHSTGNLLRKPTGRSRAA